MIIKYNALTGVVPLFTSMPVITGGLPSFYREQQSNMYRVLYYEFATSIIEAPYVAVSTVIFLIPYFWIVNFDVGNTAVKFFWYWLYLFLYVEVNIMFGHFLSAASPSLAVATSKY